jgi:hypothetical protein
VGDGEGGVKCLLSVPPVGLVAKIKSGTTDRELGNFSFRLKCSVYKTRGNKITSYSHNGAEFVMRSE